jgi:hypothetical protein
LNATPSPVVLARRIASLGLPGTSSWESTLEIPTDRWPGLLDLLTRQRLTGFAVAGVVDKAISLDPQGQSELFDAHRRAMVLVLGLERKLLQVTDSLVEAGVESVALKGAALAHTYYPSPTWRSYGDVDILVRSRDWRTACTVLSRLGFRRLLPEPRPGFDERFGKGATHEDGEGFQVDLHRTLALGPFGLWLEPDRLFDHTMDLTIGERTLRRLDDSLSLLHVCMHASLGRREPLLMPLRDVLQIANSQRVDWFEFEDYSRRWRLNGPVSHALRTASAALDTELPNEAVRLASVPVRYLERRILTVYTSGRRDAGGTSVAALAAIHGAGAKAAYLRALLFPDREFLAARTGGRGSYPRRWYVPVAWLRRRRSSRRPG